MVFAPPLLSGHCLAQHLILPAWSLSLQFGIWNLIMLHSFTTVHRFSLFSY